MDNTADPRRFYCEWPEGYGDVTPKEVSRDFFRDELGYDDEHREAIDGMSVGERVNFSGVMDVHYVTRIK